MPLHDLAQAVVASACSTEDGAPTVYVTEHVLSQTIGKAFAQGCGGVTAPPYTLRNGSAAVYGILRGCGDIIDACRWLKRTWWHIDNGYVRASKHEKGDLNGYYRITRDGFQARDYRECSADRWDRLKIPIKPWQRTGNTILVIPPSGFASEYQDIRDLDRWKTAIEREIKQHTGREIYVKSFKGRLEELLPDAFCVVAHESMAALHALIEGVPVITLGKHCAGRLSWTFENLESPDWYDRQKLVETCRWLAHNQWTLPEIESGQAWSALNE